MEEAHPDQRAVGTVIFIRSEHAIGSAVEIPGLTVATGGPAPGPKIAEELEASRARRPEEMTLDLLAQVVCILPAIRAPLSRQRR